MALKHLEKGALHFYVYRRETPGDFLELKRALDPFLALRAVNADIVVDLTPGTAVTDNEVQLLTRVAE